MDVYGFQVVLGEIPVIDARIGAGFQNTFEN